MNSNSLALVVVTIVVVLVVQWLARLVIAWTTAWRNVIEVLRVMSDALGLQGYGPVVLDTVKPPEETKSSKKKKARRSP